MSKTSGYVDLGVFILGKEKDKFGRSEYYIKFDKDVEITINGVPFDKTVPARNMLSKFDSLISYTDDESKIENYEKTKSRFEKGSDLDYMKFQLTAKLD
mgnify:CR=1 FL=1|jgi:hypothetical protein|tara:strand:- start:522 stop:818 length:297 start_codon:yes stop_codon:yes gene_type:complete